MGSAAGIMNAGAAAGSAYSESEALKAQGDYQRSQSEINARNSDSLARESIKRGEAAANVSRNKTKATAASQKAALAAQGIKIEAGTSAAETISDTNTIGAVEEMNIKTNAWREAWGYNVQANNDRATGDMAYIGSRGAATQTLLAGGMRAMTYGIGAYDKYKENKNTSTVTPAVEERAAVFSGNPQRASNRIF